MSKLQIWWIIERDFGKNTGGFTHEANDEQDAGMIFNALAYFDLGLGDKIVSSNAGGLNEWDDEWVTWYNEDGDDFDYIMSENEHADPSCYVPVSERDYKLVCEVLAKYAQYVFHV